MRTLIGQIVRRSTGEGGINVYLYQNDAPLPKKDGMVDLEAARDSYRIAGSLLASLIDVPPGGNDVDAFIDLVGESDMTPEDADLAARLVDHYLATGDTPPIAASFRMVGVFFNCNIGLYSDAARLAGEISRKALRFYNDYVTTPARERASLTVVVEPHAATASYTLDPRSRDRILADTGRVAVASKVTLEHVAAHEFNAATANPNLAIAEIVTGLRLQEIIALGGITFVAHGDRRVLWRWPAAG